MKTMRVMGVLLMGLLLVGATQGATIFDWQFDDKAPGESCVLGERVIDSSGNGRDLYAGTDYDVPEYWDANPEYGDGAAINMSTGSDELIFMPGYDFGDGGSVAGSGIVIGASQSFTIEAVVKLSQTGIDSANYHCILQVPAEDGKEMFIRIWGLKTNGTTGYLEWVYDDGPNRVSFTAPINMLDSQWHHVAFVRDVDAGMAYIYVDYEELASKADGTLNSITTATQYWYVGSFYNSSTREYKGSVDFLQMTDQALTPGQFTQKLIRAAADPNTLNVAIDVDPTSVDLEWAFPVEPNIAVEAQTIELSLCKDFTNVLATYPVGDIQTKLTVGPLDYSQKYYWRVNVDGTQETIPFSNNGLTWWFQTSDVDTVNAGLWSFNDGVPGDAINPGDMITDSSANSRHMVAIQRDGHPAGSYEMPCANYGSGASFQTPAGTFAQLEEGYDFGDGIVAGAAPVLTADNGNLTIEAVVKANVRDDGGHNVVFSYQPSIADDFWYGFDNTPATYFRVNNDGKVRFTFSNWTASRTVTSVADTRGEWHHIAGVRDVTAGTMTVYIDGVLDTQTDDTTIDGQDFIPSGLAAIGNFYATESQTRTFNGNIDFVKITRAALDPTEFVQAFELPTSPDPVNGATAVPTTYTLSWTPITGATISLETVTIATDPYLTEVVSTLTATNSSVEVVDLDPETVYYWRVDTEGTDANGAFSREGEIWSYRTPICVLKAADGDLDGNCIIDLDDFATMAQNWLRSEYE